MPTESTVSDDLLATVAACKQTESCEGRIYRPGQLVDGFRVVAFLGRGAASEVWRVRDESLRADFALKVFVGGENASSNSRTRFVLEARLLAQFDSRHIVRVHSLSDKGEHPYFTMELLRPILPHPGWRTVDRIMDGVLSGLEELHAKGVVHRDIKPSNILLDQAGNAVIADLGIAHIEDEEIANLLLEEGGRNPTLSGGKEHAIGTPQFGAPEQFGGGEITPATDLHALGVTLLALFENRPPILYRLLILCLTSSSPAMRLSSVKAVRRFMGIAKICIRSFYGLVSVAAIWLVVSMGCRSGSANEWMELSPVSDITSAVMEDEAGSCTNVIQIITLRGGQHIMPKSFNEGFRANPVHVWRLRDGKWESEPKRGELVIRGAGVLKCPVITGVHVQIESGVTLITSGKCEPDAQWRVDEVPPADATIDNSAYAGYAAFTVNPGGKLVFDGAIDYPSGLVDYRQTP